MRTVTIKHSVCTESKLHDDELDDEILINCVFQHSHTHTHNLNRANQKAKLSINPDNFLFPYFCNH